MKAKTILILCSITLFIMIGHVSFAQNDNQNRIQTEVEVGRFWGTYGHNYGINAKIGYLFNDKLFLGGGTGIGAEKIRALGGTIKCIKVPLFLSAKYYFHIASNTSIILAADGGYNFLVHSENVYNYKHTFLYPKAGLGFKVGKAKKNSLNLYAGYDVGKSVYETGRFGGFIGFSF